MKYILQYIIIIITIFCLFIIFSQKQEVSTLKAKINQTNSQLHKFINQDTTLNKELLSQEFKEDYYITQQQLNQDQIITFISILFGILFFIGIGIFVYYLTEFKKEIRTKSKNETKKYKKFYKVHLHKQNELGLGFAHNILIMVKALKNINKTDYVLQSLMGLANYKYYGYLLSPKEEINKIIFDKLKILNLEISEIDTEHQVVRNMLWTYLSQLTSIRDENIIDQVNELRSKIKDTSSTP